MRELRLELAAFPGLGRASVHSVRRLCLTASDRLIVRARTGLDRMARLRRELEEHRRQADLKDAFVALAAHELRARATVIHGLSETLARRATS